MQTPNKPLTAILRRKVREALNMAPGYGKSEAQLLELVRELAGGPVGLQDMRDAREWNHEMGYIRSEDDDESNEVIWFITQAGIAKQKSLT